MGMNVLLHQEIKSVQSGNEQKIKKIPNTPTTAETPDISCAWEDQLSELPLDQRRATLLDLVLDQVSAILGYQDHHSLPSSACDTPLTELECDSFMGILLRGRLGKVVSVLLPMNLTFNETTATVQALVDYLLARMVFVDSTSSSSV